MKDIKKEKHESINWLGRLETAGELVSGGMFLKNLLVRSAPAVNAEELAVGAGVAAAETGGSLLLPGIGLGVAALAAGSGLYHYAKKYLDEDPNDRRGKILVDNMEMRQKRAEGIADQMFDDGKYAQSFVV